MQFCVDCGIPGMRVDPGDFGPLPREADYDKAWDRVVTTFKQHAERGRELGVKMLWEPETAQIFVKPSEIVKLLDDVGDDNLQIMFDVGHIHATCVLAHNQVQPAERLEGGATEFAKMLKGRIGHAHICDTDSNTWQNAFGTHLGIGKGVIDFDALIPAISGFLRRRLVVGRRDPDDGRVVGRHVERQVRARRPTRPPRAEIAEVTR